MMAYARNLRKNCSLVTGTCRYVPPPPLGCGCHLRSKHWVVTECAPSPTLLRQWELVKIWRYCLHVHSFDRGIALGVRTHYLHQPHVSPSGRRLLPERALHDGREVIPGHRARHRTPSPPTGKSVSFGAHADPLERNAPRG